jgi:hypothetical protein
MCLVTDKDASQGESHFFVVSNKPSLRHFDLMNNVASRFFIRQLTMTDRRLFVVVDHKSSLNFLNPDYYCLEFDSDTLLVTDVHQNVSEVRVSGLQGDDDYAILLDREKRDCQVIQV